MKPNPICITKRKLLLFEREREREREREKKGIDEIPYTNLCCVFLLCFMLLSLSMPFFFVLSMSLLCVYLLSFSVSAFFFSLPPVLFFFTCSSLIYRGTQKQFSPIFSILLFKELPLFGFLIFQFINAPTSLYLSRDKTKGQSGKNATLTPTKTLPKKQDLLLIF